jgi:hypothetical protein
MFALKPCLFPSAKLFVGNHKYQTGSDALVSPFHLAPLATNMTQSFVLEEQLGELRLDSNEEVCKTCGK